MPSIHLGHPFTGMWLSQNMLLRALDSCVISISKDMGSQIRINPPNEAWFSFYLIEITFVATSASCLLI